jgi:hypothetical protein
MKIKEGYNGKELEIRISGRRNGNAELWLVQNGIPETGDLYRYRETLSYVSLSELAEMKKEIEDAILEITGINRSY